MREVKEKRVCGCGCGASIEHKHPNAKFLNQRHKDKHHNWNNPRGKFAHLADLDDSIDPVYDDYDPGDSEYWEASHKEY